VTDLLLLDAIILRGAPGVGKSTLGTRLLDRLHDGALIEVDVVRAMLARVDWADRRQHDIALGGGLDLLRCFRAQGRKPVILVDTFSCGRLKFVQSRFDDERLTHYTLSLWLTPDDLSRRLRERVSGFREYEPSRILNEEVATNRYPQETLIDASGLDKQALLARAYAVLGFDPTEPGDSP